ncbi:MAG: helix-turn-helix domain-containing protein [Clostridiales bacterium]|nr:helix-turn-helix domain-containing protein [Clostridiales bacterium]
MECNERIMQYRLSAELTQQQLADKIGVSRQTVVRWEKGRIVPTLFYAQRLADLFSTTVDELMTGTTAERTQNSPPLKSSGATVARFCVLTFIPVALYAILYAVLHSIYRYSAINGTGRDYYELVYSASLNGAEALCYLIFAIEAAFWIIRIISDVRGTPDVYLRYEIYRKWFIGVIFFMINIFSLALSCIAPQFILIPYANALLITVPIAFIADYIVKRVCAKHMTVPTNTFIKRLNLAFVIVASVILTLSITGTVMYVCGIYYSILLGLIGWITIVGSAIATVIAAIVYAIIRIVSLRSTSEQ